MWSVQWLIADVSQTTDDEPSAASGRGGAAHRPRPGGYAFATQVRGCLICRGALAAVITSQQPSCLEHIAAAREVANVVKEELDQTATTVARLAAAASLHVRDQMLRKQSADRSVLFVHAET